jgi:hypothetical protein
MVLDQTTTRLFSLVEVPHSIVYIIYVYPLCQKQLKCCENVVLVIKHAGLMLCFHGVGITCEVPYPVYYPFYTAIRLS